jgi:hypothetical protein
MNSKVIIGSSIAGAIGFIGAKVVFGYENTACVAAGVGIALYTGISMAVTGPKKEKAVAAGSNGGNDNKLCTKGHVMTFTT